MKSTHFFQMDPSTVSLEKGATTEAHAILTTDMVHVPETPAISDMYVTNVAGPTQGVTALPHSGPSSGNGQGVAIATMEAQSPAPLIESKNNFSLLPTPINVQRLEETLTNHPDQEFVSRLCNMGQTSVLLGGVSLGFPRICLLQFPSLALLLKTFPGRWPWGELQALFPDPHYLISRCRPLAWFPKSTQLSLGPFSICPSQNRVRQVSTHPSPKRISAYSI